MQKSVAISRKKKHNNADYGALNQLNIVWKLYTVMATLLLMKNYMRKLLESENK